MIKKILIANRGEIAVRIIRACREMGIETVAVYSDADRLSYHVLQADEAYRVGESPAAKSYLQQETIIEITKKSGADAVHPGYGFLAENAGFAKRVEAEGLTFIGPSPETIHSMGDKTEARRMMKAADVPIVPGGENIHDIKDAYKVADEIGYPVLLKAAAGGGGKGMRLVYKKNELEDAFHRAGSEAQSAFDDSRVFIEKYVENPRHIEFQILADTFGNVVHMGERECSVQRRHQKVVEECLSSVLDDALRENMGIAAVQAAKSCDYHNAGTVEFLLDKDNNYYFLEMNTRLQVEHPVTEMVTGIDLVKEQIKVASGEQLSFRQEDIQFRGHAIECRIYAEDPENNFAPSIGKITHLKPSDGPGIREDSGMLNGSEISLYYDPMISKLIAYGKDRDEALVRMRRALHEYEISGVKTTIPFCLFVINHEKFIKGDFDTHFIDNYYNPEQIHTDSEASELVAAIGASLKHYLSKRRINPYEMKNQALQWKNHGRKKQ